MSFQAKRIRVQLPCGETTMMEQADDARLAPPVTITGTPTVATPTPTLCAIPSVVQCGISCHQFGSPCGIATPCGFATPCPGFNSVCGFPSACGFGTCGFGTPCPGFDSVGCGFQSPIVTGPVCPAGSAQPPIDRGTIVIDAEQLPVLREQLEAQLKEVEQAEQALKEQGPES